MSCIATVGLIVITTSKSQTNQQINTVIPQHEDEAYFWYWTLRDLGEEIKAGGSGGSRSNEFEHWSIFRVDGCDARP